MTRERLIVASDGDDRHMILQYEGDHLDVLVDELCYTPSDMMLTPPSYGFWIWEGSIRMIPEGEDEYRVYPLGEWRTLSESEWEAVSDLELVDEESED